MYFSERALELAQRIVARATAEGLTVATAESCTGGLVAACLTEVAGASHAFERGFVTYSNEAKTALLGVPRELFARVGAVSEEVSRAMAEGALRKAGVDLAVSVTGIAGPGGGTAAKPVGLVHLAAAGKGQPTLHRSEVFPGDRAAIRLAAVESALALLLRRLDGAEPGP